MKRLITNLGVNAGPATGHIQQHLPADIRRYSFPEISDRYDVVKFINGILSLKL